MSDEDDRRREMPSSVGVRLDKAVANEPMVEVERRRYVLLGVCG